MKTITTQVSSKKSFGLKGVRNLFIATLFLSVIITGFLPKDANAVVYGVRPNTAFNPAVPTIEAYIDIVWVPASPPVVLTMPGFGVVSGAQAVTWDSDNLNYYAIIRDTLGVRHLATVNPVTGICSQIGILPANMSSLTYNSDLGILYGMTGSGGPSPESLYSINKLTGATALLGGPYSIGTFGEIISYNFDDMMIYHWSDGGMEMIDPVTFLATPVTLSGVPIFEVQGAVYLGGGLFSITDFDFAGSASRGLLMSSTGAASFPVALPYQLRGLAFYNTLLPVELSSFVSMINGRNVELNWSTATETNNSGFEIERAIDNGQLTIDSWSKVGYVNGNGTSSISHNYSFTDRNLSSGIYSYRLKQIDFNGNFEYFNLNNEVNIGVPSNFSLSQNYPNPFNPTTNLEFGISELGFVSLKVFDLSGKEVMTLVNEQKAPGYYNVNFNGANLSSGIYFYTIQSGSFVSTKKMTLIK